MEAQHSSQQRSHNDSVIRSACSDDVDDHVRDPRASSRGERRRESRAHHRRRGAAAAGSTARSVSACRCGAAMPLQAPPACARRISSGALGNVSSIWCVRPGTIHASSEYPLYSDFLCVASDERRFSYLDSSTFRKARICGLVGTGENAVLKQIDRVSVFC